MKQSSFRRLGGFALLAIFALSAQSFAQTRAPRRAPAPSTRGASISNADLTGGLRDALLQGVRRAVRELGRENGFLDDGRVRIPLPKNLQKTEKALRAMGQGRRVDEFVEAMNHAAEKAVPAATDIFLDSARRMTFADARDILFGGREDAATQFFRRTSEARLRDEFRPIVEEFTERVGVTQKYKAMIGRYGFLGRVVGQDASDIDGYITEKALDGLFTLIADEERKIRRDPVSRTTSLLKKVFGSILR